MRVSRKSKGINAERELIHMFWNSQGWSAVRVAGSGNMSFPSPDILAGSLNRKLAIECKTSKDSVKYFKEEELEQLKEFSRIYGAEAWIGVRFNREEWFFLNVEDLRKSGKNFAIDKNLIKNKGLIFDELLGDLP